MPVPGIISPNSYLNSNSHIEKIQKTPSAVRPALILFLLMAVVCIARDATATLSSSPQSVSFGSVTVGTSSNQTVTLINTGTGNVVLVTAGVWGKGFSISGLSFPLVLGPSQSTSLTVSFAPTTTRSITGHIMIDCTTPSLIVPLSGTGVAQQPAVSLSVGSLAFGNQSVGVASSALTSTLINTGNAALSLSSVSVTGTNPGDFSQTNTCGSSVAAGAGCTISVTFTPSASGGRSASVSIADNASGSPQTVTLSGTGTAPSASDSPSSLTFGNQSVGVASSALTSTLSNTGNAALSISSVSVTGTNPGDFSQTNTCGSSVGAGASCTISVTFTPSASGSRSASVSIADNASGSPQTVALSGAGTSESPNANLAPSTLSFGNEPVELASSSQTITLSNTGNAALSLSGIAITGADPNDFSENNTCGASLAAGGNCTLAIQFTPSASGSRAASLSITDNATGSPQVVALSGTGTHDIILTWTASSSSGVAGYYVYRGTTAGGESATPLNSTPIIGTTYFDESVQAGGTYYYLVTAVSSDGTTQSADSNEASAMVPSP